MHLSPPSINESRWRWVNDCLVPLVVPWVVVYANQIPLPRQRLLAGIGKETDPGDLLGFRSRLGRGRSAHHVPPELRVNQNRPVAAVEFDACRSEEVVDRRHVKPLARPVHLDDETRDRLGLMHRPDVSLLRPTNTYTEIRPSATQYTQSRCRGRGTRVGGGVGGWGAGDPSSPPRPEKTHTTPGRTMLTPFIFSPFPFWFVGFLRALC